MLLRSTRRGVGRVGVVAGFESADWRGRQLLDALAAKDASLQFFGLGGPLMRQRPGFQNYGDLSMVSDKPFFPHYNQALNPMHPSFLALAPLNWRNHLAVRRLEADGFFERALAGAEMLVCVDNDLLAHSVFGRLRRLAEQRGALQPLTALVARSRKWYGFTDKRDLDFLLPMTPVASANYGKYPFPGVFVGKKLVFDTFRRVLAAEPKLAGLLEPDGLRLHPREAALVAEEVTFEWRRRFRDRHRVSDAAVLVYVFLGNTAWEVKGNAPVALDAVKNLKAQLEKSGRTGRDNLVVVWNGAPPPAALAGLARVIPADEHYLEAIAAADVGAVANGDSVLEAAVLQLPCVALVCSNFYYSYLSLIYDIWKCDLNFAADGELLPETVGRHFGAKVAEFWLQWVLQPKLRYKLAQKTTPVLLDMMPEPAPLAPESPAKLANDYRLFRDPDVVFADWVLAKLPKYRQLAARSLAGSELLRERKKLALESAIV